MPKTRNRDIRVLVVDDEPMMSDSLRQHLADEGYAVDTAANGGEAIDPFGGGAHHLVIFEPELPDLDRLPLLPPLKNSQPHTEVNPVNRLGSQQTPRGATNDRALYFGP